MVKKILFVLTNHQQLGDSNEKTGFHLAEVSRPYNRIKAAGLYIDFATPKGGVAPCDPGSLDKEDEDNRTFLETDGINLQLGATQAIGDVVPNAFAGVYLPGGHGTMWDLPESKSLQRLIAEIYQQGGFIAAICHGPSGLVNVKLTDGNYLVNKKKMTCFSDAEERAVKKEKIVPFLLETQLKAHGASITTAKNFENHTVTDGQLLTGQNPASAFDLTQHMLDFIA